MLQKLDCMLINEGIITLSNIIASKNLEIANLGF